MLTANLKEMKKASEKRVGLSQVHGQVPRNQVKEPEEINLPQKAKSHVIFQHKIKQTHRSIFIVTYTADHISPPWSFLTSLFSPITNSSPRTLDSR